MVLRSDSSFCVVVVPLLRLVAFSRLHPYMSYFRSNIDAMSGYQPGEQPRGGEFIKLNTNENPYPPSPRVIEAIRRAAGDGLRKYPDPMATVFREQAAKLHGVAPDWVLAGNGSDDLPT